MNGACYWNNHQVSENEDFVKVLPIVSKGKDGHWFQSSSM